MLYLVSFVDKLKFIDKKFTISSFISKFHDEQLQGPPNTFFLEKCFKKNKESTILPVNNGK